MGAGMGRLDGQVAIVTGASKGIGKAIAEALAKEGAHIVLVARSKDRLTAVMDHIHSLNCRASVEVADMTDPSQVERMVQSTVTKLGHVNVLVNNAGLGYFKPAVELSLREFDEMWSLNVRGVFVATKAVLPFMISAKSGAVVNVNSLAGKNSFKGGAGYSATKWALRAFASSLMLEVREHNIRVITIFPGSVDTDFSATGKKGRNITQPEDVASAIVFALTAPERSMFSEIDVRPTNP